MVRKSGFGQRYVQAKVQMSARQIASECKPINWLEKVNDVDRPSGGIARNIELNL